MGQVGTEDYNLNGNNSDLFGGDTVERIHSVSIKENKEKEDDDTRTYSFETIFTTRNGYTFKLIAPKVRFKEYSMTEEYDSEYTYGRFGIPLTMASPSVEMNIELLLKVFPTLDNTVYQLIDITKYHEMSLKEIEKELGYKIKLTEK